MNRRTLIRRVGGATIATTVVSTAPADADATTCTEGDVTTTGVDDCCFNECTCRDCTICDDR